jgi:uncharacterized iron-regulated membrane protein
VAALLRGFCEFVHRWAGLTTAVFLVVVGLTGSLLAFLPELNRWRAPGLHPGPHGVALDAATLARRAEALTPKRAPTRSTSAISVQPASVWRRVRARHRSISAASSSVP